MPLDNQEFVDLANDLMKEFGVKILYATYDVPLAGQQTTDSDPRVLRKLEAYVVFRTSIRNRQSGAYTPRNRLSCMMQPVPNLRPKPGDYIVTPEGKRFPVDYVETIEPNNVPILYILELMDG